MCGKIGQAILMMALLILLPTSILLYDIENTMLKAHFWEEELEKLHGYETLKEAMVERAGGGLGEEIITDEWLKEQTHTLIANTLAYIRSEEDTLNLTISTKGLKENRERIDEILEAEVDKQIEERNYLPQYREQVRTQLLKEARERVDAALANLPDTMDLAEGYDKRQLDRTREHITRGLLYVRIVQAAGIILLLTGIVMAGSIQEKARWLSKVLFIIGISLLLVGFVIPATLDTALERSHAPGLAKQLTSDLFGKIIEKTNPQGGVLAGMGILLFLGSRYLGGENGNKEEKAMPGGVDILKTNKPAPEPEKTKEVKTRTIAKAENKKTGKPKPAKAKKTGKKPVKEKSVRRKTTKQAASRSSSRPARKAKQKKRKTSKH